MQVNNDNFTPILIVCSNNSFKPKSSNQHFVMQCQTIFTLKRWHLFLTNGGLKYKKKENRKEKKKFKHQFCDPNQIGTELTN